MISWLFLTSFRLSRFINLPTFVDDVPVGDLALVAGAHGRDVVLDNPAVDCTKPTYGSASMTIISSNSHRRLRDDEENLPAFHFASQSSR